MRCTILGCGPSSGVPVILCECSTCLSSDPKNRRSRSSIWLSLGDAGSSLDIIVDTSVDFRQQMIRAKVPKIDTVFYTHPHADHLNGIDDIKIYNFRQQKVIPVYGNEWTQRELLSRFEYIFREEAPVSFHVPRLKFHLLPSDQESFFFQGFEFVLIPVKHGKLDCLGYRHKGFAYITDCNFLSDLAMQRLENLDVLILDCLQFKPHKTHFHFEESMKVIRQLQPKTTILTHMTHDIDFFRDKDLLPKNVYFAFDQMKV
jgi:phosphoribosyl 1,2-cyclic phosphate phosphodiesterase